MSLLLDAFWRAAAYCLHPRVLMLSLLPLAAMGALSIAVAYFFWQPALRLANSSLASSTLLVSLLGGFDSIGLPQVRAALAPLLVVSVTLPVVVVLSLLLVAGFMTPSMVGLVAGRRFAMLERKRGGSFAGSLWSTLWVTLLALALLLVSIPLWFVPPLVLVLPPLIWGWLTYRVMSYDVLAEHASPKERLTLMRRHRVPLFGIGVLTGYLGAAPSLVWASGALSVVLAPVLVPLAVWIYMLVFAFSALWFAHFGLAALQALRRERQDTDAQPSAPNLTPEMQSVSGVPP